ncbi:HlyIII-domain-containing protein [Dissoconium aciculare CBS 342.82]|uniref:HlyIII-domain-containing protein n=1 Tax=Dissoconium aciculare CBS 342.82 TaxID=1314786 RepID=A0A6J3M966_9PEZI|nr:HlyIII-domain-containing protein [Dissoconium aciculare CBS 342.82]KAF1824591.1 HlyIII-domain-containing protein [Dissoconium aciculare CBS 342.82]
MSRTMTATYTAVESHEEPTLGSSSGTNFDIDNDRARQRRRRHSSYQPRAWSAERENVSLIVDEFIKDLGKRLEMLESYGQLKFDEGVKTLHDTLYAIHDRCMHVSDEFIDAGMKRHKILVETLEAHYRDALSTRATMEQKVQEGIKMLETNLASLEQRAYSLHKAGIAATASEMLDSGIAYMDKTSTKAAEIVSEVAVAARKAEERLKLKIEEAISHARKHGSITYDMLPEPWRVNPHILRGYRFRESKLDCLRSCFTLNNESFNIWSHGLGFILVLTLAFYVYPNTEAFASATNFDILIAGCFFFAACKCMLCSTVWHTMACISDQTLMERFACVDYTGISFLVAASIMTTEYTAFYCEPISRWIYLSATLVLGIAGTILPWHPTFNRADMSWLRVGFFVTLALTGFIPIAQLTYERGWNATAYFYRPILESVLVYFAGACLYAAKIPEIFLPGWFDYFGCSHNIWHVAVLGGILFHYNAMQSFFGDAFRRASYGECSVY